MSCLSPSNKATLSYWLSVAIGLLLGVESLLPSIISTPSFDSLSAHFAKFVVGSSSALKSAITSFYSSLA